MPSPSGSPGGVRYHFGGFVLWPAQRRLSKDGVEVRLIPRYFDLLQLLVEHRHEAIHRQEIFDRVWADVVVSDGALSQAIRTLRRTLDDDPRTPVFIRTVSRHGYQFVHPALVVEPDDAPAEAATRHAAAEEPAAPARSTPPAPLPADPDGPDRSKSNDPFEPLIERLLAPEATDEDRRDVAEQLHALGTAEALRRLDARPGHARARAILRDARWEVPGAGEVPLLGRAGWLASIGAVLWLRARRAWALAARRWVSASAGGALAGTAAGVLGGLLLLLLPGSVASPGVVIALAIVGAIAGAVGAAGVGAGLAAAEALARSARAAMLVAGGAVGGATAGAVAHALARVVLTSMFGRDVPALGGGGEGLLLGAAAGLGYGWTTARLPGGGMAAPRGRGRLRAAAVTGLACGAAGLVLALLDRHLVASSLDLLAERFIGSGVGLTPIARALGEGDLRPITRTLVSGLEGLLFGSGLVFGLTHRR